MSPEFTMPETSPFHTVKAFSWVSSLSGGKKRSGKKGKKRGNKKNNWRKYVNGH